MVPEEKGFDLAFYSSKPIPISKDLPVVVEIVDRAQRIRQLLKEIETMVREFVRVEKTSGTQYLSGKWPRAGV